MRCSRSWLLCAASNLIGIKPNLRVRATALTRFEVLPEKFMDY